MANEDLGKNKMKVLNYYQDRITKFIDKLENSGKKYTREDFPMKINMSIIGEEDILSNVIIDKKYSLLRKESEVYIYPTKIKNDLEEMIKKKESIIENKKKMLYRQALNSLGLAFISSLIIISGMLVLQAGEPVLKGFWGCCNMLFHIFVELGSLVLYFLLFLFRGISRTN